MTAFRIKSTINNHDSRVIVRPDGRIEIVHGMKRRCELVLNALIRLRETGANTAEITAHLQSRFDDSYTASDVRGALNKLRGIGAFFRRGRGPAARYFPSRDALAIWRALPKKTF